MTLSETVAAGVRSFGEAIRKHLISELIALITVIGKMDDSILETEVEKALQALNGVKGDAKVAKTCYALVIGLFACGYRNIEHVKAVLARKGYAALLDRVGGFTKIYFMVNDLYHAGVKVDLAKTRAYFRGLFERTGNDAITAKNAKAAVFNFIVGTPVHALTYEHFVVGVNPKTGVDDKGEPTFTRGVTSRLGILKAAEIAAKSDEAKAWMVAKAKFDLDDIKAFDTAANSYSKAEGETVYQTHQAIRRLAQAVLDAENAPKADGVGA